MEVDRLNGKNGRCKLSKTAQFDDPNTDPDLSLEWTAQDMD